MKPKKIPLIVRFYFGLVGFYIGTCFAGISTIVIGTILGAFWGVATICLGIVISIMAWAFVVLLKAETLKEWA